MLCFWRGAELRDSNELRRQSLPVRADRRQMTGELTHVPCEDDLPLRIQHLRGLHPGAPAGRARSRPTAKGNIALGQASPSTPWGAPVMGVNIERVMKSFIRHPPRKLQSESHSGPIAVTSFQKFERLRSA